MPLLARVHGACWRRARALRKAFRTAAPLRWPPTNPVQTLPSAAVQAQRELQEQIAAHGRYIERLLRDEGVLPPRHGGKPAAKAGDASAHSCRRSGSDPHCRPSTQLALPSRGCTAPAAQGEAAACLPLVAPL